MTTVAPQNLKDALKDMLDKLSPEEREFIEEMATPIDDRTKSDAKKRLEWVVTTLVINYHFVHQILGMMTRHEDCSMPTMGVCVVSGGNFELHYNPRFVMKLKEHELVYVLYHEILHLALHHCTSRRFDDHGIGNVATDLAVNELIPVATNSCEPPKDAAGKLTGCHVDEFRKEKNYSDIENRKAAEYYYDYLKGKQPKQPKGGNGQGKGQGQQGKGQGQQGKGQGQGQSSGQGQQPGGQGSEGDGELSNRPGGSPVPGKKGAGKADSRGDHGGWKQDEIADERARATIRGIDLHNSWGTMPAGLKETIRAAQTRKINWRNLLRRFYGNIACPDKESSRKRPNRRTGLIHPGSRKMYMDKHLVMIDTSGSVDSELLSQFLGVINHMVEELSIDVGTFDAEIQQKPKPFDRRQCKFDFKGRGGTCFHPVMELVKEMHYKSVLILTDGCAPAPERPKAKVCWVLPEGCTPPVEWGTKVIMQKHS